VAGFGPTRAQGAHVSVGELIALGDFDFAGLCRSHRRRGQTLYEWPIRPLTFGRSHELLDIAWRHPRKPVQLVGVEWRRTDDAGTPSHSLRQRGGAGQRVRRTAGAAPNRERPPAKLVQYGDHVSDNIDHAAAHLSRRTVVTRPVDDKELHVGAGSRGHVLGAKPTRPRSAVLEHHASL
jgi:hypothetical protein